MNSSKNKLNKFKNKLNSKKKKLHSLANAKHDLRIPTHRPISINFTQLRREFSPFHLHTDSIWFGGFIKNNSIEFSFFFDL